MIQSAIHHLPFPRPPAADKIETISILKFTEVDRENKGVQKCVLIHSKCLLKYLFSSLAGVPFTENGFVRNIALLPTFCLDPQWKVLPSERHRFVKKGTVPLIPSLEKPPSTKTDVFFYTLYKKTSVLVEGFPKLGKVGQFFS